VCRIPVPDALRPQSSQSGMKSVAIAFLLLATVTSACSSQQPIFESGAYQAVTASGQRVTVGLNVKDQSGELDWGPNAGRGPGLPLTVRTTGTPISLTFNTGVTASGEATTQDGVRSFRLTYPQRTNGEPDTGSPAQTLTFTVIATA
jgi:hypothetical protein